MGAGIARQVRDKFPGIDLSIGKVVRSLDAKYGVIIGNKIGLFQTKYDWRNSSTCELIQYSTSMLTVIANNNQAKRYDMTFPGCSNGGLQKSQVLPIVSLLPNNVHIWSY